MLLMPEQQEVALGATAYEELMATEVPSRDQVNQAMVNRVGKRIAAVAGRPDYEWEFRLIASDEMNAFALPGGKVAVYEGILPVCQNEAGLAVVMSHEIAHALARHGGERMQDQAAVDIAKQGLEYLAKDQEEFQRKLLSVAYGAGAKYGVTLPNSRTQEAEADTIGLQLMAKAGYDPREAPSFWQRFASVKTGEQTPEFFSTHPSDANRAAALREQLPKVMSYYEAAEVKYATGEIIEVPYGPGAVQQASGIEESAQ